MKVVLQNLTKIFPSRNKKSNEEVVAVNNFTFTKLLCLHSQSLSNGVNVSVPKVSNLFYNIQFRSWRQFVSVVNISVIL